MPPALVPMYGLTMRRLAVLVRILSVILAAVLARCVLDGLNLALGLTAAVVTALLLAAVALLLLGRRLKPGLESSLGPHHSPR
jgi:hypothetical protein